MLIKIKLIVVFIFIFSWTNIYCQSDTSKISGFIVDSKNEPLEVIEFLVFDQNNAFIHSTLSDSKGHFEVEIPNGNYILIIKTFGNTLWDKNVELQSDMELGIIEIDNNFILTEVQITADKKIIELQSDRLTFNVANSLYSTGSNVIDLLELTPRIDLLGDQPRIVGKDLVAFYVDDRPILLSGDELKNYLKSIRSENIEKIEVITSPGANYDAEGNSGIINIVLKEKDLGYDVYTTSYLNYRGGSNSMSGNISGTIDYSTKKFASSINLYSLEENYLATGTSSYEYSNQERISDTEKTYKLKNNSIDLSFQYFINENFNIGGYSSFSKNTNNNTINGVTDIIDTDEKRNLDLPVQDYSEDNYSMFSAFADLKLDTFNRELKFSFSNLSNDINSTIDTRSTLSKEDKILEKLSNRNFFSKKFSANSYNIDLLWPFTTNSFGFGLKLSQIENLSDIKIYNSIENPHVQIQDQSNNYLYEENIYAIYSKFDFIVNDQFSGKVGLRFENTSTNGITTNTSESFNRNFPNLFPSLSLAYYPNSEHSFSFSYNRRIERPKLYHVNPFRTYTDSYTYYEGNPQLSPAITQNIELNYKFKLLYTSIYFSDKDLGFDYFTRSKADNLFVVSTIQNFYRQKRMGNYTRISYKFTDKIQSVFATNFHYSNSKSLISDGFEGNLTGYGSYFNTRLTYKFDNKQKSSLLLSFLYRPKSRYIFTSIRPTSSLSMSFRTTIKDKIDLRISISDIFRKRISSSSAEYENFLYEQSNYQDIRAISLSLSYNFGNTKSKSIDRDVDTSDGNRF